MSTFTFGTRLTTSSYEASPFATKVKNMLTLKRIPHKRVTVRSHGKLMHYNGHPMPCLQVTSILPRPELADVLGIKYRRIPVLAIGNDVYCDSSIIASVLERRFPASQGYGTLFPRRKGGGNPDIGVAKAIAMFWTDRAMFPLVADCLPYEKFEATFVRDRDSVSPGYSSTSEVCRTDIVCSGWVLPSISKG